jgi:transcriptional regulator with XRE-family HTH domain
MEYAEQEARRKAVTSTMQEQGAAPRAARRPASGIVIDPLQLERMRDLVPLSREDLAEKTGELLFEWEPGGLKQFSAIMSGRLPADPRTARLLWLALDCAPGDILDGLDLPPGLPLSGLPRWLRQHDGWSLNLAAVGRLNGERGWTQDDLAVAVSRHWFSRDSVNKIERGERRPKARTLRAFCAILGCKPADLMPGSDVQLPEGWQGSTSVRRELLDFQRGMREFADAQDPPISYRRAGRIRYSADLRDAYAEYLAGQDEDGQV